MIEPATVYIPGRHESNRATAPGEQTWQYSMLLLTFKVIVILFPEKNFKIFTKYGYMGMAAILFMWPGQFEESLKIADLTLP